MAWHAQICVVHFGECHGRACLCERSQEKFGFFFGLQRSITTKVKGNEESAIAKLNYFLHVLLNSYHITHPTTPRPMQEMFEMCFIWARSAVM